MNEHLRPSDAQRRRMAQMGGQRLKPMDRPSRGGVKAGGPRKTSSAQRQRMAEMGQQRGQRYEREPKLIRRQRNQRGNLTAPPHTLAVENPPGTEGWSTKPRGAGVGDCQLALGAYSGCVLRDDGSVWGWGFQGAGAFSNLETSWRDEEYPYYWHPYHAMPVSFMTDVKEVVSGGYNYYAVKNDGTLWHWGNDDWATTAADLETNGPQRVGSHDDIVTACPVGIGAEEGCVYQREDGSIWGAGFATAQSFGYHSDFGSIAYPRLNPINVSANFPENIVQWDGSLYGASGLVTSSGEVWIWDNVYWLRGQPDAGTPDNPGPFGGNSDREMLQVSNISDAVEVRMGDEFCAFARTSSGQVKAWGEGSHAVFGMAPTPYLYDHPSFDAAEDPAYVRYPTLIPGLSNVVRLSAYFGGGIVRLSNGQVWGWGRGEFGRLGHEMTTGITTAHYGLTRLFEGKESSGAVATGSMNQTFAVDADCVPWFMGQTTQYDSPEVYYQWVGYPTYDEFKVNPLDSPPTLTYYTDIPYPTVIVTGEA